MVSIYTGFLACVLTFELRRALSASPFQRLVSHQLSYLARSWHWHIKRLSIPCGGQPESQFGADYLRKKHLSQKISELRCIENIQVWEKVVISYNPASKLVLFRICVNLPKSQLNKKYRYEIQINGSISYSTPPGWLNHYRHWQQPDNLYWQPAS